MMHRIVALIVATRLARVRTVTWSRSGWKNCNNWVSKDPERRCAKESDDGIPAQRVCPQCRNETLPPRPTPPPRPRPTPAPVVPPPVLSPGAPPPCAVDERDRGCALEWVPLETRESGTCRAAGVRRRDVTIHATDVRASSARLGDRALLYLGDSVSNEMKTLLLDRNEDLKRLAPGGGFLNFRRTDADALFGQVAYAAEADRDLGAYERKMVEFLDESYRDVVYIFNVGLHEESQPELYARTPAPLPVHFYSVNGGYTSPRLAFERLGTTRAATAASTARAPLAPGNRKFSYRCAPSHMRAEYASCQTFGAAA
ncbi:hypothetical protein JL722_10603 [Aureococcus anophagefferens]|nr:hypothetical protein JL722_10603 [Aureococcus anophagefferens]